MIKVEIIGPALGAIKDIRLMFKVKSSHESLRSAMDECFHERNLHLQNQKSLLYSSRITEKTALKLLQMFAGYGLMVKINRQKNKKLNKMFPTKEQGREA